MILYLVGISCVGKTTIGKLLADRIGFSFYDLDEEIAAYYGKPIERIQDECFNMDAYREKGSVVLEYLFSRKIDAVIAGTMSGLKLPYLREYKKHKESKDLYSIHIKDSFENVLNRLTFFDKDSKPIKKSLDDSLKLEYLKELKADYNYFKGSFDRADFEIDIRDTSLNDVPEMIIKEICNANTQLLNRSERK